MKSHITVKGTKYRVVKALLTFEQAEDSSDLSVCNGCVFEAQGDCRTRFRSKRALKCVEGDDDSSTDRADYILIHNTREALAEYVARRLT